MNNAKYLILKKQTKDFSSYPIFKVLNKKSNTYTILGKSKKLASNPVSIYEINIDQFPKNSWIELDDFVNSCTIINRKFYRNVPVVKNSLSGGTYNDVCYTNKSDLNCLVAVYENLWLCIDYAVNSLYFLSPEYIDENLEFGEIDNKTTWTKQSIRNRLTKSVDSKINKLYDSFEL